MSQSIQTEIEQLQQAIAAQENLRATLGDAIVDATIHALQDRLANLEKQVNQTKQQRKLVTVLMADVSGFTAMSEQMDAEDVTDVMNALWNALDAEIINHGGLIDKHMGDAVMALWGANEAREDDVENAIRAALGMQNALQEFREDHQSALAMRIGINTGQVLLGEIGSNAEFTAMGDTVNLASRLEHAAPVGGILISHDSYRHVRGIFDATPQAPLTVKGKTAPIQTYVILRAKPRAFRMSTRGVAGVETRMIGRDTELAALQSAYEQAISQSTSTMLTVVGEAGIGKSRLLYEFDNWIELRPEGIFFFKGRATPQSQTNSYSLIRDVFRERFHILDSDKSTDVIRKFRAGMAGILTADEADIVGHFIGFDFSSSQAVQNLLGGTSFASLATAYLTNYFQKLSTEPLVIFLEDLHWADDNSLDYIIQLTNAIKAGKLLLVGLARPEFFERHSTWDTQFASYQQINLQLLSTQDSQRLVENVLQKVVNIPAELRDLIVESAEGNPFYVEELIKMLVDDGIIHQDADQWHIEMERIKDIYVPPTLTEVVQARLDGLPHVEKEILKRASVVGRLFWDDAVAQLLAASDNIEDDLDSLNKRELIFRRDVSAFSNTDEYIFKHAILRDVTYEMVLLKLRRTYHNQVAQWLENHTGERVKEYLSIIADHYEFAGENQKAVTYLLQAGIALNEKNEFNAAVQTFQRALSLADEDDIDLRAQLHTHLGDSYECLSEFGLASDNFEQGLTLAQIANDKPTELTTLIFLGWLSIQKGNYAEATGYLNQAVVLAEKLNNQPKLAKALLYSGIVHERESDFINAENYYGRSLKISQTIQDKRGITSATGNFGNISYWQGDYGQAQHYWEEALATCRQSGDQVGAANMLNNIGAVAELLGAYDKAQDCWAEGLIIWEKIGDRTGIADTLTNLGGLALNRGDYLQAQDFCERGLIISREIGSPINMMISLDKLGHIALANQEIDLAHTYFKDALREALQADYTPYLLHFLASFAKFLIVAQQAYQSAAEMLGLVIHHEATTEVTKDDMGASILAQLHDAMTEHELETALAHGGTLDLVEVVNHILASK